VSVTPAQLRRGFGPIYRYLSRCGSDLSAPAKLVLLNLLERLGQSSSANPRQERIARDIDYSERAVRSALDELAGRGFISAKRLGLGRANVYTLDIERILDWAERGLGARDGAATAGPEPPFFADQDRSNSAGPDRHLFAGPDQTPAAFAEVAPTASPTRRTTREEPPKKNHQEKAAAAALDGSVEGRVAFYECLNPSPAPTGEDERVIRRMALADSDEAAVERLAQLPLGQLPYPSNLAAVRIEVRVEEWMGSAKTAWGVPDPDQQWMNGHMREHGCGRGCALEALEEIKRVPA
jgi:hypothetical protein